MNDIAWMSKPDFFVALDDPTNENDSTVFKQMNLFGPYYIQSMSFKQCMEYPKDLAHVTYKDRLPLYRMCDLAYPIGNAMGSATRPLRKLCMEKCKELQKSSCPEAKEIGLEMTLFMKKQLEHRFDTAEEGVMQAYHPIVPYEGTLSRYEAEKSVGTKKKPKKILQSTENLMKMIGPRITNPDFSDEEDLDYGFSTLGDNYNQSAMESLEKACAHFHLVAYGRYANDNDKVAEGFMYFDDPEWINDKWENVMEAIMDATTNVPPSIPTVNISLRMKNQDSETSDISSIDREKAEIENFNIDAFRQFLAIHQRYQINSSSSTDFMNMAQYDYIAGYVNDGPVMHINDTGDFVMPVIDLAQSNMKKLLVMHPGEFGIAVKPFPNLAESI